MDRTNLFFLVLIGGAAWWAWNEYQKQVRAQEQLRIAAQQQVAVTDQPPNDLDVAAAGRWLSQEFYGG